MLEDFFSKIAGLWLKKKLDLREGPLDGTKPWYQSVTIWSSIVSGIVGTYISLIAGGAHLPAIPGWVITILSAVGVYGRATATEKIASPTQ